MKVLFTTLLICIGLSAHSQVFNLTKGKVSFFSSTPVEDIAADNSVPKGKVVFPKKEVAFVVRIDKFIFDKQLMQDHFNENYMESDKFPTGSFSGIIAENIDPAKDGTYPVTVNGTLNIHGVAKPKTIKGTMNINKGLIKINSTFDVALVDHNITVPTLVFSKIAEVIKVTTEFTLNQN